MSYTPRRCCRGDLFLKPCFGEEERRRFEGRPERSGNRLYPICKRKCGKNNKLASAEHGCLKDSLRVVYSTDFRVVPAKSRLICFSFAPQQRFPQASKDILQSQSRASPVCPNVSLHANIFSSCSSTDYTRAHLYQLEAFDEAETRCVIAVLANSL